MDRSCCLATLYRVLRVASHGLAPEFNAVGELHELVQGGICY